MASFDDSTKKQTKQLKKGRSSEFSKKANFKNNYVSKQ